MAHEPLSDANDNESYITLNNNGDKLVTNKIHGFLVGKIVFFVMSFRASQNDIYISRHGESVYNLTDRLGGDSSLSGASLRLLDLPRARILCHCIAHSSCANSDRGKQYAQMLGKFVATHEPLQSEPLSRPG